ncbi:MAG: endonuclease domain-containing protein [Saprospiraceae bacterium]
MTDETKEPTDYNYNLHRTAKKNIFVNAFHLRNRMTKAENILWEELRNKKLGFKFRRQHPFCGFILDFYCHQFKFSTELDGKYHDDKIQKEYDEQRTEIINREGLTEIRFTNDDVYNSLEKVITKIKFHLSEE